LVQLFDYIADASSPNRAEKFISRIEAKCMGWQNFQSAAQYAMIFIPTFVSLGLNEKQQSRFWSMTRVSE
jgi:hypothetical protein